MLAISMPYSMTVWALARDLGTRSSALTPNLRTGRRCSSQPGKQNRCIVAHLLLTLGLRSTWVLCSTRVSRGGGSAS
jgi:hypothetical protein